MFDNRSDFLWTVMKRNSNNRLRTYGDDVAFVTNQLTTHGLLEGARPEVCTSQSIFQRSSC